MRVRDFMFYNSTFKISGNQITIRNYQDKQFYNYIEKEKYNQPSEFQMNLNKENLLEFLRLHLKDRLKNFYRESNIQIIYNLFMRRKERKKQENFIKSAHRAREAIFDLVQCNSQKWLDFNGREQTTKFLTLTFKKNITDLTEANAEITKFFKRLSYKLYNTRKNVLKYVSVPELQNRGAWHYHIVLFNCAYIEFHELKKTWAQGSVFINAIKKEMDTIEISKYITKYISKNLSAKNKEDIIIKYKEYKERGLINKKRYTASRGLHKPLIRKNYMEESEKEMILSMLKEKAIVRNEEKQIKEDNYYNEFRGEISLAVLELTEKDMLEFKQYLETRLQVDLSIQSQQKTIDFRKMQLERLEIKRKIARDFKERQLYEDQILYLNTL